jgi:glycerol uptake facilitator-like aquaporin
MSESCLIRPRFFNICEFIGSMFLVIAAISPIILLHHILGLNIAIAVIGDAIAVSFVLFALIEIFGPICTAYFNPAVCFAMALAKDITWFQAVRLSFWQITGGLTGVVLSHIMFYNQIAGGLDEMFILSTVERSGGTYVAEILGAFILVLCIMSLVHQKSDRIALVVGLLVGGMLLSTSSTMFANPQVTIARVFTFSAAGIQVFDAIVFIIMQFIGAGLAFIVWKYSIKKCAKKCN